MGVAQLLAQSAELATADVSAHQALRWGLELVCSHLGLAFGRAMIVDHEAQELVHPGIWYDEDPERHRPFVEAVTGARTALDFGLAGAVVRERRAIATNDQDPNLSPRGRMLAAKTGLKFAVGLPVLSDEGVEGVIQAFGPRPIEIDEELLSLFAQVGLQVGRVIERDRARRRLHEAERLAGLGAWSWDVERDVLHCAPELFALHGVQLPAGSETELLEPVPRRRWLAGLPPGERHAVEAFADRIVETGRGGELEYRVTRGGAERWLRLHARVTERRDGHVACVGGYAQDVTARRRTEERRRQAQLELARSQRVLERIARGEALGQTLSALCRAIEREHPDGVASVMLLDREAGVLRHGAGPSLPANFTHLVDQIPAADGMGACGTAASRGVPVIVEDIARDRLMGSFVDLADEFGFASVWSQPITRPNGEVIGTFAIYGRERHRPSRTELRHVRAAANLASLAIERSRAEAALHAAANYDSLTLLPNRTRFLELVAERLRQGGGPAAVMLLEVERFKLINDSLGHLAGERILVEVAKRLGRAVGEDGVVARFGGNEFTVLLPQASETLVAEVPDRVLRALESPILLDGGEFFLTATVGVALSDGGDALALVRDADAAMSAARAGGPRRRQVYDHRLRAQTIGRLNREIELRRGIERGELELHYQPVLDLAEQRWAGVEALVRWRHPTHGLLAPAEFIPLAEETRLIVPLGTRVLEMVAAQAASWTKAIPELGIAANISVHQLADPGIATHLLALLQGAGVAPHALALEVTESALMQEIDSSLGVLAELVRHGVRVLIDDFGTGYSSLARLGELPISGVKIDRRFVAGVGSDPGRRRVLRAITELVRAHGLDATAEGVEDAESLSEVDSIGCRFAQGYHIGRPAPADQIEALLRRPPVLSVA